MTVGVAVKVYDGIVLAADSATTLELQPPASYHVYNSANKVFHLHRDLPVGAMTWGVGNLGSASIATLAKDLRRRLMGKDSAHKWNLGGKYTVEEVAKRLVDMVFDELYSKVLAGHPAGPKILLGFLVAGYSAGSDQAEAWLVQLEDPAARPVPIQVAVPDSAGWFVYAQPEAVSRLAKGYDPGLLDHLLGGGLDPKDIKSVGDALAKQGIDKAGVKTVVDILNQKRLDAAEVQKVADALTAEGLNAGDVQKVTELLTQEGIDPALIQKVETELGRGTLEREIMAPPMPFADAIGLAKFLVDTTVGYRRYVLGPDTVGGQVEIAGITRHEGFKWISRKHYYPQALNPKDPNHDH